MSFGELSPLTLPLLAAFSAVLVMLVDLALPRLRSLGWFTAALLGGLLAVSFLVDTSGELASGVYRGNAWTVFFSRLFLAAALLATLGAMDQVHRQYPRRQAEYYALLLFSLVGMLILPGARDLLLLVVAFELMGIPLYVLAAYAKTDGTKTGPKSPAAEAALKLYLVGATSTAITVFGLALVVGMSGTTKLSEILGAATLMPLTKVGMMFVLGGISFKLGLVPFHMWVPDTYQGAPTPFVAFLSVAPKAAGMAALIAIFVLAPAGHGSGPWSSALFILAAAAMIVGNVLAIPQTDVRRLLGYSGVAQMGYVLLGVATARTEGLAMGAFYLAGYVFTNMGAFFVVHAVAGDAGRSDLVGLAGLSRRAPWLGVALLVFLLSLAGIPFVVGFWAKLYVLLAAFRAGFVGLVALGVVLAVIGLFYYMQVARAAFMAEPTEPGVPPIGVGLRAAVLVCLIGVVGFGLWPRPIFDSATAAAASLLGSGQRQAARE